MAEQKGCHGNNNENEATATITKMVPRRHIRKWCHGNISVSIAHGGTGAKGSERERVMQDGRVNPASGFPQVSGMQTSDNSNTVGHLGGIPSKRAFPGGSKTSREVVVHGPTVVIHLVDVHRP